MEHGKGTPDYFGQAFDAHKEGRLQKAETGYRSALQHDADNVNARRLLGLVLHARGAHEDALEHLEAAIELAPHDPVAHTDLSQVQFNLGLLDEALQNIRKATNLAPNTTHILALHGSILTKQKRHAEAEALLRQAADLEPQSAEAQFNLGSLLLVQHKWTDAVVCFMAVIHLEPNNAAAWSNCGIALSELGQTAQALDSLTHSLELRPDSITTRTRRANLLANMGNHARALSDMNALVAQHPKDPEAVYNRGTLYARLDLHEKAAQDFRRAVKLAPNATDIRANYARTMIELNLLEDAYTTLKEGLKNHPDCSEFHNLLGVALNGLGNLEESLRALQRAYVLAPDNIDTLHNLGLSLDDLGRHEDASSMYSEALILAPHNPDIQFSRATSQMSLGHFSKSWPDFQARTRLSRQQILLRHTDLPKWKGENLGQTSLIIHTEQGYGDILQFSRFIYLAKKRTRHIILEAPKSMVRLLKTIQGLDMVTDNATGIHGVQCPLMDLPYILQLDDQATTASIENTNLPDHAYLSLSEGTTSFWTNKLANIPGLRIGIAWQGRREKRQAPHLGRAIPLQALLDNLPNAATIFPLQKDISEQDAITLNGDNRIQNLTEDIKDFADTAALVHQMSFMVTIDTAPAHLSLALGKPTYVLLPFSADWRWMKHPNLTPWYPSATLLRQTEPGSWNAPLILLKEQLSKHATFS